ncbi:hypothetical protein EDB83DRAFT_2536813 [Lactarius deliciosus]|nr:hypothetical protein EDB83DRAFT_2536813 [Lactarius deliciosus]
MPRPRHITPRHARPHHCQSTTLSQHNTQDPTDLPRRLNVARKAQPPPTHHPDTAHKTPPPPTHHHPDPTHVKTPPRHTTLRKTPPPPTRLNTTCKTPPTRHATSTRHVSPGIGGKVELAIKFLDRCIVAMCLRAFTNTFLTSHERVSADEGMVIDDLEGLFVL